MTNTQNLELNVGDQIILCADVSASMSHTDCPGNKSRIDFCKEQFKVFASEANKYDPDGCDYFTFGHKITPYYNQEIKDAIKIIDNLKANEGMTKTADVIQAAWDRALEIRAEGCEDNIVTMIVTDGEPSDPEAVKTVIRNIADKLNSREEFGIIFLTVGQIDSNLRAFLTDLDDNLNAKHDIVDVKDFMQVDFVEAFIGAITD